VPAEAAPGLQRYEQAVLPLLPRHGGRLERRLRTPDGTTEVHVLSFASEDAYRAYLADPGRSVHRALLGGAEPVQRVVTALTDVFDGTSTRAD
jgi:hypothetical protein